MRFFTICLLLVGLSGIVAAEGTLFYDPPTGELFFDLDVPEGRFITFDITSQEGRLLTENYNPLGGATIIYHVTNGYLADNAGLGTFKPDGFYNLGAIYPPNASQEEFLADVTSTWGSEASTNVVPFEIEFARPVGVPVNSPGPPIAEGDWATSATIIYNANTGELVMDNSQEDGGLISGFVIESDELRFRAAASLDVTETYFESSDKHLFAAGLIPAYAHRLGLVLEPGLSESEFADVVSNASFWSGTGGTTDFQTLIEDSVAFSLTHVPEPNSSPLALLAFLYVTATRSIRRNVRSN